MQTICSGIKIAMITDKIHINMDVTQEYSLFPVLLNTYLDELTREWKSSVNPGMDISSSVVVNNALFVNYLQEFEDHLEWAIYRLNTLCFKMEGEGHDI